MYEFRSNILRINQFIVRRYARWKTKGFFSQQQLLSQLEGEDGCNAATSLALINSWRRDNDEKIEEFLHYFFSHSNLCVLIGARRMGKTAFVCWLAQIAHERQKRKVFVYNMSDDLPDYFVRMKYDPERPYECLKHKDCDCMNDSLIIHDECHKDINSKVWNDKKMQAVKEWASTTAHRNQSIIWTSQLASNIGLDMIRYSSIKAYKAFSLTQIDTDREQYFQALSNFLPEEKSHVLIQTEDFFIDFYHPLPDFFTDKISRAFQ